MIGSFLNNTAAARTQTEPLQAEHILDGIVHSQISRLSMGLSPISLNLAASDWLLHLLVSPGKQSSLAKQAFSLSQQAWLDSIHTNQDSLPESHETDSRFNDPSWNQWPYVAWKNGFKAAESWWDDASQLRGVMPHHTQMMQFFSRQGLDALSPSNWGITNPQVLQQGISTFGQSWFEGSMRWFKDACDTMRTVSPAPIHTSPPDLNYRVGQDVAVTPGKVVFRNHLIELIQYLPSTAKVYAEPILIVPSCIMKFYILDLSAHNSMVRFLVEQGFTVFMISWRNPDATDRNLGMDDYILDGLMTAMATIKSQTKSHRIHTLGYCLGGTFLAIAASLIGAQKLHRLSKAKKSSLPFTPAELPQLLSVTLLAAQTDFSEPGELGVYIDDDQLETVREEMARIGYLSGCKMAASFQFLNSRDLIWSHNTQRYLLGQNEVGNDMVSWNADTTHLPQRMHSEYLDYLFLNNALAQGRFQVAGQTIALKDITVPILVVGTEHDHVSPWQSVYKIRLLTDVETTFILASGGHNAGIISELGHPRRSYQMSCNPAGQEWIAPTEWVKQTPVKQGSWWKAMNDWLSKHSGTQVAPPTIKSEDILCDAPGEYVMVRYVD